MKLLIKDIKDESTESASPDYLLKKHSMDHTVEQQIAPGQRHMGIYFALLSAFCAVLTSALRKGISRVSAVQMLFCRTPLILIFIIAFFFKNGKISELKTSFTRRMTFIGSTYCICNWLFFTALSTLSVSELTTLFSTNAILNGVLESIFLNEPYYPIEKILGAVCLVGVLLIVRPPPLFAASEGSEQTNIDSLSMPRYLAGLLGLLATVSFSMSMVATRSIASKYHPLVFTFQNHFVGFVGYGAYFVLFGTYESLHFQEYMFIVLISISSLGILYGNSRALELEKSSIVGLVNYSQLVFSLLIDLAIFGEFPSFLTIIGAAMILASCIYLVLTKS